MEKSDEVNMEYNEITRKVIGAAIEAHRELGGPGLLEKVYEAALCKELANAGLKYRRQVECPIIYKGENIGDSNHPLRIDILVEDLVVIECKAVSEYHPLFAAQCLTYLRLMKLQLGLVINFDLEKVVDGIERVVNPAVGYIPLSQEHLKTHTETASRSSHEQPIPLPLHPSDSPPL